jgi:hypothetical protein
MGTINYDGDAMVTGEYYVSGWWFGTWLLFFHILGRIVPTDSYFSEGLKPPTRLDIPSLLYVISCGIKCVYLSE